MYSTDGLVVFSFGGVAATRRPGGPSDSPLEPGLTDVPVFVESPARDRVKQDRKAVVARLLDSIRDDDDICCTD